KKIELKPNKNCNLNT
ncbi:hypothetical protein D046_0089B, partial [Vibrio parahaemolyticus V-223/04]